MNTDRMTWKLAWTEVAYRRRLLWLAYGIVLAALTARLIALALGAAVESPHRLATQIELTVWVTIATNALVTHALFSGFKRQKRDRLVTPLPVSARTVVSSRLLAVLLVHVIALVYWTMVYALLRSGLLADYDGAVSVSTLPPQVYDGNGWTLFTMLAVSLYVCLVIALAHVWNRPVWGNLLFWFGALVFTTAFVYPAGSSPDVFVPGYAAFHTVWGALYYGAIAAAVAGLYVFFYTRKKSFYD
jgi:hypothetical protein